MSDCAFMAKTARLPRRLWALFIIMRYLFRKKKTSAVNFRPRLLFRRTLSFGSSGEDTQLLCKLLNKDPDTRTDPQEFFGRPYT